MLAIVAIFVIAFINSLINNKKENGAKSSSNYFIDTTTAPVLTSKSDGDAPVSKIAQLKDAQYNFETHEFKSFYNVDEIIRAIDVMKQYAQSIDLIMGAHTQTEEEKKLADKCRLSLIAAQKKHYPVMRKAYATIMKNKLWEEDIDVTFGGKIITLTGGYFAANANIKKTQEDLVDIFTKLRFSQVNYKWMKYADEFTYYKLETQPDASLIY